MLISCNKLKSYIKNSESIDWLKIWDIFTIRTAEVEKVIKKGDDMRDVVVAEIISCETHPKKDNYHILKVSDGENVYDILCGASNVRVGLKTALVKVGGMVSGFEISEKKIAGVLSQGMLCAMDELGIGSDHSGIIELSSDAVLGTDIKEIFPIEDIIVEIDNKSLTNRPDLWGHYGIAREIAAITNNELLPLDIQEVKNDLKDLEINIENPDLCYRYSGLRIDNLKNNKTPMDMQIFLHYTGNRSISLMVDLTNYVMLELGQPMHAFDANVVKKISVGLSNDKDTFKTLDGVERRLNKDTLMIKNGDEYFAVAGVMGGLNSEILPNTDCIFLESATFNATSVRKTAINLGLRTEASARYEKSLDPNMTDLAIKRYLKLLSEVNPDLIVASNLTDVYKTKVNEKTITLEKELLKKYMGFELDEKTVCQILTSLDFKVTNNESEYIVVVPTYRATKDIELAADIIEEIARIYGYENFEPKPLCLDLTFVEHENTYQQEYETKSFLANRYMLHEVHSYLWYETELLKSLGLEKENITLLGKTENNILRDDMTTSLLTIVKENFKYQNKVNIFEIGTVIINNENHRHLGIVLAGDESNAENNYNLAKNIVSNLIRTNKNKEVSFALEQDDELSNGLKKSILVGKELIGYINLLNGKLTSKIGKKKSIVTVEIDYDKFLELKKENVLYKPLSKYPEVTLDYTIIMNKDKLYKDLENVLKTFNNEYINSYSLIDRYENEKENKYTIRFLIGSNEKTLSQKELEHFKEKFISHIKKNDLDIIQ